MRRVDRWGHEWAAAVIDDTFQPRGEWSGINAVERILRDPGIATGMPEHKVLWWPKNRRVSLMSKAAHQLTPTEITLLVVHWGTVLNDDGTRFTKKNLAQNSSISVSRYHDIVRGAKVKLSRILAGWDKNGIG